MKTRLGTGVEQAHEPYRTGGGRDEPRKWLFAPHRNTLYGETRVYSRFEGFVGDMIAGSVIRLPFDLLLWAVIFYLGHLFGATFLGR
jgi:hypothetical protein